MTIEHSFEQNIDFTKPSPLDGIEIYKELGLIKHTNQLSQRSKDFTWDDLGEKRMPFSRLNEFLLRNSLNISAPRTGHIGGTWERIMDGGGGSVAFNRGVIELGIGKPLLFDTNQIGGDPLYNPGFIVVNGEVIEMQRLVYLDGAFREPGKHSIYSPFAATKTPTGDIVAINHIHKERLSNLPNVQYTSEVLYKNWGQVQIYLERVVRRALTEDTASSRLKVFSSVIDRWVTQSGFLTDVGFIMEPDGIIKSGIKISWDNFFELIHMNLMIAANPELMPEAIKEIPQGTPYLSKEFMITSLALLETHYNEGATTEGTVNPHFHWGGFQMAGFGNGGGYFGDSANIYKTITNFTRMVEDNKPKPIAYTLMPAAIFSLLPHKNIPLEVSAINGLLQRVSQEPLGKPDKTRTIKYLKTIVPEWLSENLNDHLSQAFIDRFSMTTNPLNSLPEDDPTLIVPEEFYGLSIQQLLLTVGTIKNQLSA